MRLAADLSRRFVLPQEWIIEMRLLGFAKLWLWAAPALLVLAAIGWNRQQHGPLAVMAASAALTFLGYFFIPFDQGHGWGYRYFHSAWGALPLLGAAGIVASNFSDPAEAARVRHRMWLGAVLSISLLLPLRLYQVGDFIAEHLEQMPPPSTAAAQVVMLHGRGYYAFDLVQNDPWLRDKRTVMLSDGEREAELRVLQRYLPGCSKVTENEYGWVCAR